MKKEWNEGNINGGVDHERKGDKRDESVWEPGQLNGERNDEVHTVTETKVNIANDNDEATANPEYLANDYKNGLFIEASLPTITTLIRMEALTLVRPPETFLHGTENDAH